MGFKEEGETRWTWVLLDRERAVDTGCGSGVRGLKGTALCSRSADDWDNGGREQFES
ncbi:hypothetical protein BJV74DRAFT_860826 [Russula compacta]|nr:hypothetical protein BJV74DRAFT_860826 [Russula compacta]